MPWLATAVLLIIWEVACIVFDVPEIILPRADARSSAVFVPRFDILLAVLLGHAVDDRDRLPAGDRRRPAARAGDRRLAASSIRASIRC